MTYRATKSFDEWLQRGNLSQTDLFKMSPSEMAVLGRSWESYQKDVTQHQAFWNCTDEEILRAQVESYHSVPRPDGSLKPKPNLDELNRRSYN